MLKGVMAGATLGLLSALAVAAAGPQPQQKKATDGAAAEVEYRREVEPLLQKYCVGCHAAGDGGAKMGNVALGAGAHPSFDALRGDRALFRKVLENLRSGTMPPSEMPQPTAAERAVIERWVKGRVFRIDPANPDPGRVTVRRLNRAEYRNTVRDLIGVDYDTQTEFPPDDAGHGFDNLGDALTLSPLLMEKYLNAAQAIVTRAVPTAARVTPEIVLPGASFVPVGGAPAQAPAAAPAVPVEYRALSYYEPATVTRTVRVEHPGDYQIVLDLSAHERYVDNQFDYNKCRLIFRADGRELLRREFNREGGKRFPFTFDVTGWAAGEHTFTFEVQPLTPDAEQIRTLTLRVNKVTLRGPEGQAALRVEPPNYRRFFPRPVPDGAAERRAYARELLGDFARRAFRRPVDDATRDRLAALAEGVYSRPGQTFEAGVAQGMVAVLASPRFLFREEGVAAPAAGPYAAIDEHALASRLSYFLWSTMPDDELSRLADQGKLRANLTAQVERMLADPRSEALVRDFSGQWLQTRDIENVPVNPRAVLMREIDPAAPPPAPSPGAPPGQGGRRGGFRPRVNFDGALRQDLRREADAYFGHVVREDRSVRELLNGNYTFLNERLAQFYGLESLGIKGEELRKVTLPADSPRGGVLTMGAVLAVTSNPTRTSPVKRGLFLLDNIVGAPAPPPPPGIPPLEDAATGIKDRKPTLREVLAAHRDKPECASCHKRLDPPGLALENFNALGLWRDKEFGQPIESAGTLVTGEKFKDVRDLKRILATARREDFYRCLTEKLLTYALGRGLEDYDVEAVDRIVQRLEQSDGRFSALLMGVVESAPFQKSRVPARQQAFAGHKGEEQQR